jgi:hypothetical protein
MLGSRSLRVKARARFRQEPSGARAYLATIALATLALATLAGCYWRYYPKLMETHLELLVSYADKLAALAHDRVAVPPDRWGEFTYPLERARDFARIAEKRFPDRESLRAFRGVLDRYEALVEDPAILARPDAEDKLARGRVALDDAVATTRAALERERR